MEEFDDNIDNKPIIIQIEKILENEKSYITLDDILKGIFQKFNITHDDIKDIIKSDIMKKEKCKLCHYMSEYTYMKHILRCNTCNHINFCKECYMIIKNDWNNKFSRKNNTNKIINCNTCNERLYIDICSICDSHKCYGGCLKECIS